MKPISFLKEVFQLTFATFIVAVAVFFFLVPSHAAVSSITGLSIVLANFFPLTISQLTM
ncbi:MAG: YitT family protein, partial [Lachnospiraceae bacterium]|nr:YitT family protein [Lachnospiraceae bacterium]